MNSMADAQTVEALADSTLTVPKESTRLNFVFLLNSLKEHMSRGLEDGNRNRFSVSHLSRAARGLNNLPFPLRRAGSYAGWAVLPRYLHPVFILSIAEFTDRLLYNDAVSIIL
jgi:hypothetical protein